MRGTLRRQGLPTVAEGKQFESMADVMKDLLDHPTLGIIRLDYDYPPAAGDIDSPESFGYPVVYRVVPGLTFQMAQSGNLTDEVAEEFDEAIKWLSTEKKVSAITGDCGFMMWFEARARLVTRTPVFLSPLMQLPTISAAMCKKNDRVVVITANVQSLRPMQSLINEVTGTLEEDMHFVYVGCEDIPHFGYEVEHGLKVDVEKAEPGILARTKEALRQNPNARAILLECTELPPYASAIRAATGLPVYDAITNCDFVMNAFMENENFGLTSFYKKWDGTQEAYVFGQHLTDSQKKKLVTKPVDDHAMHMIMDELQKTNLFKELSSMGFEVSAEEAAHAIAHEVEMKQMEEGMEKLKGEMKKEGKKKDKRRFKRVRNLFEHYFKGAH